MLSIIEDTQLFCGFNLQMRWKVRNFVADMIVHIYNKVCLLFLFLAGASSVWAEDRTPAFPGAEGFGMYTTGGRGGKVCHVTTLEDGTQEGTFRWACSQSGARTIVFDVSGTIFLKSELRIKNDNVTIAGQTAPGDGICIANYPFVIACKNIIIRYMRFRLGNEALKTNAKAHEGDGLGGMDSQNIIIDHCSVSWSIDECLSVYGSRNITVQWCIASQSLNNAGHSKGAHGYGGNWGGSGASYHHNLVAHHISRTPRLGPRPGTQTDERMDMRNNVIYNWIDNGCYGGEGMNVNIVNNYYKPGPDTKTGAKGMRIASPGIRTTSYTKHDTASPNEWDKMWHVWGKYYVDGNVNEKYPKVTDDNWTYGIYNQIDNSKVDYTFTEETKDTMRALLPTPFEAVTTHAAEEAFRQVLAYAGASLHRDAIDAVIVSDALHGETTYTGKDCKRGIINSQDDLRPSDAGDDWSAWPELKSETASADTDGDGMPDDWETAHGLDPANPDDGSALVKTSGFIGVPEDGEAPQYTNLEVYMNSLVSDITERQNQGGTLMSGQQTTAIVVPFRPSEQMADSRIFSLEGRQVGSSPRHGVYIRNHKKIIIKN